MKKVIDICNKYKFILIGIIIVIILIIAILCNLDKKEVVESVEESISMVEEEKNEIKEVSYIKVDIKGAINNPGVYEMDSNSRVIDLINKSGGLTKYADTSIINLSKKLEDGKVIIIYTKEEIKKIKEGNVIIQYIDKECNCESIENSSCIDPSSLLNMDDNSNTNTTNNSKININNADVTRLQTLTGIGESRAKDIIEYRNTNGNFKTIEDIKNVSGIGDTLFEKIKDNITV